MRKMQREIQNSLLRPLSMGERTTLGISFMKEVELELGLGRKGGIWLEGG